MSFANWLDKTQEAFGWQSGYSAYGGKKYKASGPFGQGPMEEAGYKKGFTGLHAGRRALGFMQEMSAPGGYLSDDAANPLISQIQAAGAAGERERQSQMGYGLASSGVNPGMAQRIISEGEGQYMERLGGQLAGAQEQIAQRQYGAGEQLLNLMQSEEAEIKTRAEDQRRYREARRDQSKAQMMELGLGMAGLGLSAFGGPMGAGAFYGLTQGGGDPTQMAGSPWGGGQMPWQGPMQSQASQYGPYAGGYNQMPWMQFG